MARTITFPYFFRWCNKFIALWSEKEYTLVSKGETRSEIEGECYQYCNSIWYEHAIGDDFNSRQITQEEFESEAAGAQMKVKLRA